MEAGASIAKNKYYKKVKQITDGINRISITDTSQSIFMEESMREITKDIPYNINNTHTQCSSEFYGETWDGEIPTTIKYISNTNRGVCYYYADAMKYYSSSMLDINVSSSMLMGAGHYFV